MIKVTMSHTQPQFFIQKTIFADVTLDVYFDMTPEEFVEKYINKPRREDHLRMLLHPEYNYGFVTVNGERRYFHSYKSSNFNNKFAKAIWDSSKANDYGDWKHCGNPYVMMLDEGNWDPKECVREICVVDDEVEELKKNEKMHIIL